MSVCEPKNNLPRRHKFAKPTNPLKKISCLLSKVFHSKESYTSLASLCLRGRIILWLAYGQLSTALQTNMTKHPRQKGVDLFMGIKTQTGLIYACTNKYHYKGLMN